MRVLLNSIVLLTLFMTLINAAEYRADQAVFLTENDTIKTDLFATAETVTISGILAGDLFTGAKFIEIKGMVEDDVIAGGKSIRITNKVGDMVIGFGQSVVIDGEVGGDVLVWAEEVWLTNNARIKGNLLVGTSNLNFEGGKIDGKIMGGAGKAFLNGNVLKNVDLSLGNVDFGEEYSAQSGTKLKLHERLPEDAAFLPEDLELSYFETKYFFQGFFFYWSLVSMFIVGILLVTIFKNFSIDLLTNAKQNLWKNLGTGALLFILTPISVLILAVLVITIPVSLIILATYLILLYLSTIISGIVFGDYIINLIRKNGNTKHLIWSLLVGVLLISLITKLPAIGWFLSLLFICFGIGTLVLFVYQATKVNKQAA